MQSDHIQDCTAINLDTQLWSTTFSHHALKARFQLLKWECYISLKVLQAKTGCERILQPSLEWKRFCNIWSLCNWNGMKGQEHVWWQTLPRKLLN